MEAYIMEQGYVSPNDAGIMAQTDSRSIQTAVDAALASGLSKVVIPRYNKRTGACRWDVDEAIILDSNLEVVLDNCYIRQMDGSMDNVFRNHDDVHIRKTLQEEQHNIIIRGQGNAVIDGGAHNGLNQETSLQDGRPHVEKNNVIRLHNLRYFRLENFTILNQRWWAINLCHVEEGLISGLHISCGAEGRNLDGIDLRFGCNNITIQDLTGQSQDDFIALSAFRSAAMIDKYQVDGKTLDIHDINIRNIAATSAECAVIALQAVMAPLPNIEPVSLLTMLFAVTFGWKSLYCVYTFVIMEVLFHGIGVWNINYLYIWTVLAAAAVFLRNMEPVLGWALLSGVFGLCFGALCGIVDLFIGGFGYAAAKWVSGIPFDLLHCGGNFAIALVLWKPLRHLLEYLRERMKR